MNDHPADGTDEAACSSCGRRRSEVARLIAGPASHVCDRCVAQLPPEARRWLRWLSFTDGREHLALPWRLPGGPATDEVVIFQHVPKSGGTTVDFVLAAAAERCGRGYRRFGVSQAFDPPVWMAPGWTGAWDTVEEHTRNGGLHPGFGICSGHFPHGVHRLLGRPARYVTLIRDPLARELSSYNYHHQNGVIDDSRSLEALLSQRQLLDNPQTRMLAGPDAMRGECTEETYRRAVANLDRDFALVGVTERAHDFLCALLGWLGLPAVRYTHARVTALRRLEAPDVRLSALLRQVHAWDLLLHALCRDRWSAFEARHRGSAPQGSPPPEAEILVVSGERRPPADAASATRPADDHA